jgi:hypothetical protein
MNRVLQGRGDGRRRTLLKPMNNAAVDGGGCREKHVRCDEKQHSPRCSIEICRVRLAAPEPHGRCVGGRDESRKRVNKVKRSQQGLRLAAEVGCRQLNQVFPRAVL